MSEKSLKREAEDLFESIKAKALRVSSLISILEQENAQLKEQLQLINVPVRYYQEGGMTYAVYGSSSIAYVEYLRSQLGKPPQERNRLYCDWCQRLIRVAGEENDPLKHCQGHEKAPQSGSGG